MAEYTIKAKGMTQVKQEEEERIEFKVRNILGYETKVNSLYMDQVFLDWHHVYDLNSNRILDFKQFHDLQSYKCSIENWCKCRFPYLSAVCFK